MMVLENNAWCKWLRNMCCVMRVANCKLKMSGFARDCFVPPRSYRDFQPQISLLRASQPLAMTFLRLRELLRKANIFHISRFTAASPKGGSRFYQNVKTTPILIVEGFVSQGLVKQENVGIALNGMQVRVRNLNNQQDANNTTGTVSGDGRYVVILMDFLRNAAAQTGDVLELTVFDPTGTYSVESIRHPLSASEIKAHIVSLNDIRMRMLPKQSALLQNYPNPFNPETWIPYQLSSASEVAIQIYDIAGHFVRTLFLGNQPAGYYQKKHRAAYWDGHNEHGEQIASGVYFYTLRAGTFHATRKFTLMK